MDLLFHGYHLSLFIQNSHTVIKEIKGYTSGIYGKNVSNLRRNVTAALQFLLKQGESWSHHGGFSGFRHNPSVPAVDFPDQDPFSYMDAEQDMAVCINALYGKMIA